VVIVGGDVHIGAAFALKLVNSGRPIYQLTSSAVSNPVSGWFRRTLGALGPSAVRHLHPHRGQQPRGEAARGGFGRPNTNPFTGMNAGLVQLQRIGGKTNVRFKLLGTDGTAVSEVFESALL
jgi:hypothetical protein